MSVPEEAEAVASEVKEASGASDSDTRYDPLAVLLAWTMPEAPTFWRLFFASVFYIALFTFVMVDATIRFGVILTIDPFTMGLIFLAAGTSVPDALGSIAVARQGEGDMAVSNALGSNIFDIMLGLGLPWTIRLAQGRSVRFVGSKEHLVEYVAILTGIVALFMGTLIVCRWQLRPMAGVMLLSIYVAYLIYAFATRT